MFIALNRTLMWDKFENWFLKTIFRQWKWNANAFENVQYQFKTNKKINVKRCFPRFTFRESVSKITTCTRADRQTDRLKSGCILSSSARYICPQILNIPRTTRSLEKNYRRGMSRKTIFFLSMNSLKKTDLKRNDVFENHLLKISKLQWI